MDAEQVKRRYRRLKNKVHAKVQQLQQQRLEQLGPTRLFLPAPWEPVLFTQPTCMYMVLVAHDGQFVSLHDKSVSFKTQSWTYGPAASQVAWPPLWGCMPTYATVAEAKTAAAGQSRQGKTGALVLACVQVSGKGYSHPDGRMAVAALLFDKVLEYVPQRPKERIVDVEY